MIEARRRDVGVLVERDGEDGFWRVSCTRPNLYGRAVRELAVAATLNEAVAAAAQRLDAVRLDGGWGS